MSSDYALNGTEINSYRLHVIYKNTDQCYTSQHSIIVSGPRICSCCSFFSPFSFCKLAPSQVSGLTSECVAAAELPQGRTDFFLVTTTQKTAYLTQSSLFASESQSGHFPLTSLINQTLQPAVCLFFLNQYVLLWKISGEAVFVFFFLFFRKHSTPPIWL